MTLWRSLSGKPIEMANETVPDYWDWRSWWSHLIHREPGLYIGGLDNPYLLRYYLIPRNPYFNVYLHEFLRSDDDRALHDHPWWFVPIVLKGGYWEHREGSSVVKWRGSPSIAVRKADTAHRVELDWYPGIWDVNEHSSEKPAWTLIFTGPKIREWGFKCPQGWRHWKEFVDKNGCGE